MTLSLIGPVSQVYYLRSTTDFLISGHIVFGQIASKMKRRVFSIFITFSDAYSCTYVG